MTESVQPASVPDRITLREYFVVRLADVHESFQVRINDLKTSYDTRIIDIIARFDTLFSERDRLYDTRFKASEVAVNAALAAQEKAVNAAYAAQEKAVLKAEDAQKEYNIRSNEFRGQLDDQAKLLMSRAEALGRFDALDARLVLMQKTYDDKLEAQRLSFERTMDTMASEISSLRESRSANVGAGMGQKETIKAITTGLSVIGALIFIIGTIITIALVVVK